MPKFDPLSRLSSIVLLIAALSGCANPEVAQGINDPFEEQNRANHAANVEFDKAILRPASEGYGNGIPEGVRNGISNFASNLSIPGAILNDLLQFHIEDAAHNTVRLLVNTTVGIGGIFDPATNSGLEARDSNFGETLHVWGFGEGAYAEHLLLGPSTTRDTIGGVVDLIIDPLSLIIPGPERFLAPAAAGASVVGSRYTYSETIDSVLYDSEDSYAQARLFYLENRRFKLGGSSAASDEELYDIYEESYE
jgi:phospholipid-binding lipoprotein MlaA